MKRLFVLYDACIARLNSAMPEGVILLFMRVVLAGVFWRSGQTKTEGSWLTLKDSTYALFETEYSGLPLPPHLAANLASLAEHILPVLLVLGLFTRFSALGLLCMTLIIQIFVYPDAWWTEHSLWSAMALVLIVKGGGLLSADAALVRMRNG